MWSDGTFKDLLASAALALIASVTAVLPLLIVVVLCISAVFNILPTLELTFSHSVLNLCKVRIYEVNPTSGITQGRALYQHQGPATMTWPAGRQSQPSARTSREPDDPLKFAGLQDLAYFSSQHNRGHQFAYSSMPSARWRRCSLASCCYDFLLSW